MAEATKTTQTREVEKVITETVTEEVITLSLSAEEATYLGSLVWLSEPAPDVVGKQRDKLWRLRSDVLNSLYLTGVPTTELRAWASGRESSAAYVTPAPGGALA